MYEHIFILCKDIIFKYKTKETLKFFQKKDLSLQHQRIKEKCNHEIRTKL